MNNRVKLPSTRTRTDQDGQVLRLDNEVLLPVPVIEWKEGALEEGSVQ
jgi:hypothetical protein